MSDYLKLFSTAAEQTAFRNGDNYIEPHVSCLEDGTSVKYNRRGRFIDLGLPSGTLWSDRNMGASSPEDYGNYFGWGELSHDISVPFNQVNYSFYDSRTGGYTKYNETDNLTTLEAVDDVAISKMGEDWHMPTVAQFEELISNCSSEETTINNKKGVLFTSNVNGNTVFFPYAGYYEESSNYGEQNTSACWTVDASLGSDPGVTNGSAFTAVAASGSPSIGMSGMPRYDGLTIRPVQGTLSNSGY